MTVNLAIWPGAVTISPLMINLARNTCRLTLALALAVLLGRAVAGDAPKPAPKTAPDNNPLKMSMDDVDWSATKQSFLDVKSAVVLSGSAWIRFAGGIKCEADNIVFYRETNEMYAEGHCILKIGESTMEATAAYMDVDSGTGYMVDSAMRIVAPQNASGSGSSTKRGNRNKIGLPEDPGLHRDDLSAVNKHPAATAPGEELVFRARDPYGVYEVDSDPQARTSMMMHAEKFIRHSPLHLTGENTFISNDEMVHPIYGVKAESLDFYMMEVPDPTTPGKTVLQPEKVIAKGAQIQIFGFNLFKFPTITYDLSKKREYFSFNQGSSGRWGNYGLLRIGYGMGQSTDGKEVMTRNFELTHVYIDVDERWKRGPALGLELAWQTQGYQVPGCGTDRLYYEYGSGHIRTYGEDEFQISDEDAVARARHDLERRIQPKIDGFPRIQFDANLLFLKRRLLDNAGPPSFAIDPHENEVRGLVELNEHIPIKRVLGFENVYFDAVYERQSDRDFNLEFFPRNYNQDNQSEALLSMRKASEDWSFELLYRTDPEKFDSSPPRSPVDYGTFTGYEPAMTYTQIPTNIGYGILVSGEMQGTHIKRYFEKAIYDQPDFDTDRLAGWLKFQRPVDLCIATVTPYIGTQQALYDNSRFNENPASTRIDGKSTAQGAAEYGFDIDSRFYGTFCDLKNEELGIDGFRHVVEPKISYAGVSNTYKDPAMILDFDQYDDLIRNNVITFSLDQTAQTHRAGKVEGDPERTISVAGFDTALDVYPAKTDRERVLSGDTFGLLRMQGFLRVLDVVRFDGGVGIDPQKYRDETSNYGITIDPHDRWRLHFDERFNYTNTDRAITGSDQYRVQVQYELSDRWAFGYEQVFEKKKSLSLIRGRQLERWEITRHYGPFDASLIYSVDKNLNDHGFFAAVRPTIVSRNLILPENDNLVNPSQVNGDFEEPESRNFDPFQILRKQRLKNKSQGGDVPAPPEPTSQTDQKNGETVDVAKAPAPAPKPPKKVPVDADDWTTPASMPTSVRER